MLRSDIKNLAKQYLKPNLGNMIIIMLIVGVVSGLISMVPGIGSIAVMVITPPLTLSISIMYLALPGSPIEINKLLIGFDDWWSAFKVQFFTSLYTFLWSLLLFVPGIIKGISYSMAMFILAENKGMPALEAIKKSQEMMEGHKMEFFILQLSFIGWILLCGITCGLAALYVAPYMGIAGAIFYNSIRTKAVPTEFPVINKQPSDEEPIEIEPVANVGPEV